MLEMNGTEIRPALKPDKIVENDDLTDTKLFHKISSLLAMTK